MRSIVWIFPLLIPGFIGAQDAATYFARGNEAYQAGQWDWAAAYYQQALDQEKISAALLYNLGNVYFKSGDLGKSILFYERAKTLAPHDEDIAHNLAVAQARTIDRFEIMPAPLLRRIYQGLFRLLLPDQWALLGLILLSLSFGGLLIYFYSAYLRLGFALVLAGLLLGVSALGLGYQHRSHRAHNRVAIVMAASSYVKTGPSESAEDAFILHEGTKATVTESYAAWQKVRLPDGKLGWIPAEDIALIDF